MISAQQIEQVRNIIRAHNDFIITTHVNPDGDGVGSEVALDNYLRQQKKRALILNLTPIPANYRFLDPQRKIEVFHRDRHMERLISADAIFILDISEWGRLRELGEVVREMPMQKICIDHHPLDGSFADVDIIQPEASSTGEVIFDVLTSLGARMNIELSEALYTAILSDTGGFRFSNTSARVHEIAATLLKNGVDHQKIYKSVYENQSIARVRLLAQALDTLQFDYDKRLAWMTITQQMLHDTGATLKDIDGFSDFPRTIRGVEVALLFVELEDSQVKISFRSRGNVVINDFAKKFTGGGHAFASGATVPGPLQPIIERTVADAASLFRELDAAHPGES